MSRSARSDEIIENAIRDRLVKGALVSKRSKIKFERLAFNAERIGHVFDHDLRKIHLACDRAKRGEVRRLKPDGVRPPRRARKSLQLRLVRRSRQACFTSPEQCQLRFLALLHGVPYCG